ncbi:serine/threonine-protein kinase [Streptomyces sp. NPDC089799]|uniref:serine/threonine-protein kinase n=1 Tax=Streptomyces sp. NPDC089799 TaxID=3155066 RepID=UPI0034290CC0
MKREPEALRAGDPTQVGPYRITGRLGGGGMGTVYLGRSRGGRAVAVKVVRPELAEDAEFRRRFVREVTAARQVNGVFTAGLIDADPDGTPPWLATAYVSGPSLNDAVRAHGPWPEQSVLALAAGVAEALEAIHGQEVVHRDLKPSNVLLSPDGPRVIDFGISVVSDGATELTRTGFMVGTPGFMAPEQLTGEPVTAATDVFALGALLTFTATGTGPFGGGTVSQLMYRVVHEEPDIAGLPPRLRDVVGRCLAKDPAARPTVSGLLEELSGDTEATAGVRWLPSALAALLFSGDAGGAGDAAGGAGGAAAGGLRTDGTAPTKVDPRTPTALDPRTPARPGADPAAPTATTPAHHEQPRQPQQPPRPPQPRQAPTPAPTPVPAPNGPGGFGPPQHQDVLPLPPTFPEYPVDDRFRDGPRPGGGRTGLYVGAAAAAAVVIGLLAWLLPRAWEETGTRTGNGPVSGPSPTAPSTSGPSVPGPSASASTDPGPPPLGPRRSSGVTPPDPSPSVDSGPGVVGVWRGTYRCTQGLTRLDLTVNSAGGNALRAVFAFSAHPDNPAVPNGSFTMIGFYENGRMVLRGDQWIVQPPGYLTVDLQAVVTGSRPSVINGAVVAAGSACSTFAVERQD